MEPTFFDYKFYYDSLTSWLLYHQLKASVEERDLDLFSNMYLSISNWPFNFVNHAHLWELIIDDNAAKVEPIEIPELFIADMNSKLQSGNIPWTMGSDGKLSQI